MYGQINDTKHTKTFISHPFGNSLDLPSVGDLYFFCSQSTWVGRQKKIFFAQRLKKNFFSSILMGRSGNRKQDFFFFQALPTWLALLLLSEIILKGLKTEMIKQDK